MSLPQILEIIHDHSQRTGKSLREIFKKTKVGDSDGISKFEFSRLMTEVSNEQVDATSLDRLTAELDASGNNNEVSFTELLRIYNEKFQIRGDAFEQRFN